MFIMNKDRTVIIKPNTIYIVESDMDGMVNIVASDGRTNYILGKYDIEYANKELNEIFNKMYNSEFEQTHKMASDDDVKDYYERKSKFEPSFIPQGLDPQGFQAIDDEDIPF